MSRLLPEPPCLIARRLPVVASLECAHRRGVSYLFPQRSLIDHHNGPVVVFCYSVYPHRLAAVYIAGFVSSIQSMTCILVSSVSMCLPRMLVPRVL
ncbi:unnamed protein product [Peniophora sp. CBMAI 1063]|nr:unnamed protein product [Peniophora sp. CBMAI 1063]